MSDVWLVASGRTPFAPRYGALESAHPTELLAAVVTGLMKQTGLEASVLDELVVGCANPTGSQALTVGRGTALALAQDGLSSTTIERGAGSGLCSFRYASALVASGQAEIVFAAGVEHMSRYPAGSAAYEGVGVPVGPAARSRGDVLPPLHAAEAIAATLDHEALTQWSDNARNAAAKHHSRQFRQPLPLRVADSIIASDIIAAPDGALAIVNAQGVLTVAMMAPMADGAAGAILASSEAVARFGLTPRARVSAGASAACAPDTLQGPAKAAVAAAIAAKVSLDEVGVVEIDDTTAVLPVLWQAQAVTNNAVHNAFGGALGQGLPLGANGLRMVDDLLAGLHNEGDFGLAATDDGLGGATAVIIQRCD